MSVQCSLPDAGRSISLKTYMTCNLSIFIVNNFYCVMNCLNINRVRFYRTKCIDIVTLKVLPTSCSRYKKHKIPKSENEATKNIRVSLCKFHNKIFRTYRENDKFFKILSYIHLEILHIHFNSSQNVSFISLLDSLVKVTNEWSIACKYFR